MTLTAIQRESLTELRREYERVLEERRQRDIRLSQLQTAINALVALDTDEPITFAGTLTDACRAALKNAGRPLAPMQVRDIIVALGYDLSQHKSNPLASIHSVLKRLAESGDVEQLTTHTTTASGTKDETLYFWTGRAEAGRAAYSNSIADFLKPDAEESLRALESLHRMGQMTTAAPPSQPTNILKTAEHISGVLSPYLKKDKKP
jgi:hypothetical protein